MGPRPLKIAVLGDCGVGKTKLLERFLNGSTDSSDTPTNICSVHARSVRLNGVSSAFPVEFWDASGSLLHPAASSTSTAGHPSLHAVLHRADAVLLVFDASQPQSYRSLPQWLSLVNTLCPTAAPHAHGYGHGHGLQLLPPTPPVLVAAAKSDLNPAVWEMQFNFPVQNGLATARVCPSSVGGGAGAGEGWDAGEGVLAEAAKVGLAWRRHRTLASSASDTAVAAEESDGNVSKVVFIPHPEGASGEPIGGAVAPGALLVPGFTLPPLLPTQDPHEDEAAAVAAAVMGAGAGTYESELAAVLDYLDAK